MTLDPQLRELRRSLGRFRRRVWLRRMVRHGSFILAAVMRCWSSPSRSSLASRRSSGTCQAAVALCRHRTRACSSSMPSASDPTWPRPRSRWTRRTGLSDRVSTALAAGQRRRRNGRCAAARMPPSTRTCVELQRRDALDALVGADPRGLRIPLPRRQSAATAFCALLLIPAILLPNIQNDILAQQAAMRAAAETQAQRLDETANRLQEGRTAEDPRSQLAEELQAARSAAARPSRGSGHEPGEAGLARGRDPLAPRPRERAARGCDQLAVTLAQSRGDRHRTAIRRATPRRPSRISTISRTAWAR